MPCSWDVTTVASLSFLRLLHNSGGKRLRTSAPPGIKTLTYSVTTRLTGISVMNAGTYVVKVNLLHRCLGNAL
jgi:hypothetical protein